MKGKIVRGSGFRGCLNYLLADHKGAEIIGGNMVGREAQSLAKEFAPVRRLRPGCKKPVLHIALRMPEGEDVSAEKWLRITLRLMKLMGLSSGRPWLMVKHPDQHVHILLSRVAFSGDIWLGRWEALKLIEATQIIEKEFGLTITPGLRGQNRKQVRLTSGQLRKISREMDRGQEPEVPVKVQIAERIEQAIGGSNGTFDDFQARLEKLGVSVRLNTAKNTSHISGISFEFGGITMKGSKVARAFGWQGIQKLLVERKDNENIRTPQPGIEPGPRPDDSRASQPVVEGTGQHAGPTRKRPGTGNVPTSPPAPVAVSGDGNSGTDVGADLLLALLAKSPVAAGGGAIADPACPAPGKTHIPRERVIAACEDDDEPAIESDGPTMSF